MSMLRLWNTIVDRDDNMTLRFYVGSKVCSLKTEKSQGVNSILGRINITYINHMPVYFVHTLTALINPTRWFSCNRLKLPSYPFFNLLLAGRVDFPSYPFIKAYPFIREVRVTWKNCIDRQKNWALGLFLNT